MLDSFLMAVAKGKGNKGGLLVLLVLLLLLFLLAKKGSGNGEPGAPVVNLGSDLTTTLNAVNEASVTINYTVSSENNNPVSREWAVVPSGALTEGVAGQATARFTSAGNFTARLTVTDTINGKSAFDEVNILVGTSTSEAIFLPGVLSIQGEKISEFRARRSPGETFALAWPCQNVGNAVGSTFIAVTEGGIVRWVGPAMPVDPGATRSLTASKIVDLPEGIHDLIAEMVKGTPEGPGGVVSSQPLVLEVVTPVSMRVIGLPLIDGLEMQPIIPMVSYQQFAVQVSVRNDGGDTGQAKLSVTGSFGFDGGSSPLISIPGHSTVTLLAGAQASHSSLRPNNVLVKITDHLNILIAEFTFIIINY